MTAKQLVVLGAGGHGKVVVATARSCGWEVVAIFDDAPELRGREILGIRVSGPLADAAAAGLPGLLAIGGNATRSAVAARLTLSWASVVHPAAIVHETVRLGPGTVVFAGAVIQPDTQIGAHAIINTAASIDHDCRLGDFTHVAPGARLAGGAILEAGAFVGTGAVMAPGIRIGKWATLGAGGVAIRDVAAGAVVGGVPAQPLGGS